MKKIFANFVLSLSIASTHAQINYGAKAGLAVTTLAGDNYNPKIAFHLGGFVRLPIKNSFSIQPEIYYAAQGVNWEGDGKTSLGCLNIPVLPKLTTSSGFYAESGPQVGLMLVPMTPTKALPKM